MSEHDRIHGTRTCATDAFNLDAPVLEQAIKHAPGERPVRPSPLQRERYDLVSYHDKNNGVVGASIMDGAFLDDSFSR